MSSPERQASQTFASRHGLPVSAAPPKRWSSSAIAPAHGAFTLVELILAIALTAILLVVISTAVEVQLRAFQNATRKTDRDRLVLALLRRIAADLHGAVGPAADKQDTTVGGSSGEDKNAVDDSAAVLADEFESTLISSIGDTSGPIGLRGESDQLWIDILRARASNSDASDATTWFADVPVPKNSGIRTILYYVVSSEESTAPEEMKQASDRAGGLVRREFVEPIASYARQLGLLEELDTSARPMAADVIGIVFRYHDGNDWCDTWDSTTTGELPRAIEITLLFAPDTTLASGTSDLSGPPLSTDDALADAAEYRLVVSLPIETPDDGSASTGNDERETAGSTSILNGMNATDPDMEDEP